MATSSNTSVLISEFPNYAVWSDGRVWSFNVNRWLRPKPDKKGYLWVCLCSKGQKAYRYIHQLVLTAFVGPCPPGLECRHLDGSKDNNHVTNLAWGTNADNQDDKVKHGTFLRGEQDGNAKLTEQEALEIIDLHKQGWTKSGLARRYGVCNKTISNLTSGRYWKHLPR